MDHRNKIIMWLGLLSMSCLFLVVMSLQAQADEGYKRAAFGSHWIDADGDCQDTRQEVLIAESKVPVVMDGDCKVLYGLWECPLSGKITIHPRDLDIDHVVPLKEAWLSGANEWSQSQRITYANDLAAPGHLSAVMKGINRAKGAKDPAEWVPHENPRGYIERWLTVKTKYNLSLDPKEVKTILDILTSAPKKD